MGLELPVWGAPTAAWAVATLGLVGASVLDRFLDDDGSGDDGSGGMDGDDDPFGGDMGDGGMGGGMGGGGGDMGGGGDGFDDFDGMDEWDDEFDDGGSGGGGGAATDELENRLDELENEVASLSSTVSTVRSENEEISNAVDDIEEDVRNLLDIYEMVTRGINPFVDDSGGFDSVAGGGEGSFGIFDDGEDGEEEEDLDEDVANADADGFFDDDLLDEEEGDGFDGDDAFDDLDDDLDKGNDDLGGDEGFDDLDEEFDEPDDDSTDDAASETETADEGDDMNDDGKSFSELKEEYDSGEADWAEEGDDTADEHPFEDGDDSFDDPGDETDSFDDEAADDGFGGDLGGDDLGEGSESDGFAEPADPDPAGGAEPDLGPDPRPGGDPAEASGGFEYVGEDDLSGGSGRGKPYLTELPGDYVGDLLVMEWLEFLVSESDVTDAVRAINYYERIEWVGPDAAARLRDFLSGFGTIDRNLVDRPGTDRLVREHHTRSLRYVTQLNGTSSHTVLLDRWDDLAGGSLVGGGPVNAPRGGRRGGRVESGRGGRADSTRGDRRDRPAPKRSGHEPSDGREAPDERERRTNGADHDGAADRGDTRRGTNADGRDDRPDGRRDDRRDRNGSTRPMSDPNPRFDRADPADGGWGDGR